MENFKSIEEFKELSGYEIDGIWYPRVTKIVDIKAKPALYRFYGKMSSFAEGERIKNRSASEGTLIHEAAEALFLGKELKISPAIAPSIETLSNFIKERKIEVDPQYVERRLINYEHRYAGTLDAIALIGGKLGVLDIKTSKAIYRDYSLQTSAYLAAMKDEIKGLETRWILRIDQDQRCIHCGAILRSKGGKAQVTTHRGNPFMQACMHEWGPLEGRIEFQEFPYWQEDFDAFLGAKKLWEWEHMDWLKKVGYLK